MKNIRASYLAFFITGFLLATLLFFRPQTSSKSNEEIHFGQKEFINPLLGCNSNQIKNPPNVVKLENQLIDLIAKLKKQSQVEEIAIYYRDLNNGPTIGIEHDYLFTTASLLKVPVMMAVLKHAEQNSEILKKKFIFDTKKYMVNVTQNIEPELQLIPNQMYSVYDLTYRMIVYSDNVSAAILFKELPIDINKVLKKIGVRLEFVSGEARVSVKNYASLFRVLYNSTFLSEKMSNEALKLLSEVKFKQGLNRLLPESILISHKFGERRFNNVNQFHDCGIVYYPKRPYLLCVMTRGNADFATLVDYVAQISYLTFIEHSNKP